MGKKLLILFSLFILSCTKQKSVDSNASIQVRTSNPKPKEIERAVSNNSSKPIKKKSENSSEIEKKSEKKLSSSEILSYIENDNLIELREALRKSNLKNMFRKSQKRRNSRDKIYLEPIVLVETSIEKGSTQGLNVVLEYLIEKAFEGNYRQNTDHLKNSIADSYIYKIIEKYREKPREELLEKALSIISFSYVINKKMFKKSRKLITIEDLIEEFKTTIDQLKFNPEFKLSLSEIGVDVNDLLFNAPTKIAETILCFITDRELTSFENIEKILLESDNLLLISRAIMTMPTKMLKKISNKREFIHSIRGISSSYLQLGAKEKEESTIDIVLRKIGNIIDYEKLNNKSNESNRLLIAIKKAIPFASKLYSEDEETILVKIIKHCSREIIEDIFSSYSKFCNELRDSILKSNNLELILILVEKKCFKIAFQIVSKISYPRIKDILLEIKKEEFSNPFFEVEENIEFLEAHMK